MCKLERSHPSTWRRAPRLFQLCPRKAAEGRRGGLRSSRTGWSQRRGGALRGRLGGWRHSGDPDGRAGSGQGSRSRPDSNDPVRCTAVPGVCPELPTFPDFTRIRTPAPSERSLA